MRNRRQFVANLAAGVVLIPLLTLSKKNLWAAERITEDHPTASALGYVHDASATDTNKYPKRAGAQGATQFCDNCSQYKTIESGWGSCGIFPNYLVADKGWCNVWVLV